MNDFNHLKWETKPFSLLKLPQQIYWLLGKNGHVGNQSHLYLWLTIYYGCCPGLLLTKEKLIREIVSYYKLSTPDGRVFLCVISQRFFLSHQRSNFISHLSSFFILFNIYLNSAKYVSNFSKVTSVLNLPTSDALWTLMISARSKFPAIIATYRKETKWKDNI